MQLGDENDSGDGTKHCAFEGLCIGPQLNNGLQELYEVFLELVEDRTVVVRAESASRDPRKEESVAPSL